MLDEVVKLGGTVEWEHKVVGVGQDEGLGKAWVEVELRDGGRKRVEGDYVVGCDGANSMVRRSLFGEEFPGKTWDAQIIATNVSDTPFVSSPQGYRGECGWSEIRVEWLTATDVLRL
jgi:2-polyprenyl-6-methoxyphenol hydroxylase-like FAD-dependent oxidoreductase